MTKLLNKIEYTDIEDDDIAIRVSEFADLYGYKNGESISMQSFLESGDVEDLAKDYFLAQCHNKGYDHENTIILYNW